MVWTKWFQMPKPSVGRKLESVMSLGGKRHLIFEGNTPHRLMGVSVLLMREL